MPLYSGPKNQVGSAGSDNSKEVRLDLEMFDLIKKSYKKTKEAQYQRVNSHGQSSVGPPTFCTLTVLGPKPES
jgi:hypothetical protein